MRLALGTVQFGVAYGAAGFDTPVPDNEIARILDAAHEAGIRRLDTAPAYGDIEKRLASLIGKRDFTVVSKISAMAAETNDQQKAALIKNSITKSRELLGKRLVGVIFHNADEVKSAAAREAAEEAVAGGAVKLGASHYDPSEVAATASLWASYKMAQLPGNAFDQRVTDITPMDVEITVRSAFLQGLLLMSLADGAQRLPAGKRALQKWHEWCAERSLTPLTGALSIAKGFANCDLCVVGVNDASQLGQIVKAWGEAKPIVAKDLACDNPKVYDPRLWSSQS